MTRTTRATFAAAGAVGIAVVIAYLGRSVVGGNGPPEVAPAANAPVSAAAPAAAERPSGERETLPGPEPTDGGKDASSFPLDEASLMTRLRGLRQRDPQAAIALARQGNERFPDSADAPERASILIHALASQGQAMEARGEAESVVNRYPDSSWVREIESFTGAHRHRNVHLESDGSFQIY